jgi:hypothetical protein
MRRLPIIMAAPLLLASPTLLNPSSHSPRHQSNPANPARAAAISQFQLDTAEGKAHPEGQSKRQDPLKREDSHKQASNPVDQIVQQVIQNVETRIATRDRRESDVSSWLVWLFAVYFLLTLNRRRARARKLRGHLCG